MEIMADRHMEDWISAFEAFGALETVADLTVDQRPAWIFSRDGRSVHWANPAGGAMFGASRFADMAGKTGRQADPFARQLANVARSLGQGGSLARLRLNSGARAVPLLCQCRPVRTTEGQRGIFVIAMDATPDLPVSEAAAAAFASGIKSTPAGPYSFFPPYDYLLGRALPAIAFKSDPHLKETVFEALILMTSPVPGLRPFLAGRDLILKVPNPTN